MPRSIIETMAITQSPSEWMVFFLDGLAIIPVAQPSPELMAYTGKMIFHSSGFPDPAESLPAKEEMASYQRVVEASGVEISANAIVGYGTVKTLYEMTPEIWERDRVGHGELMSLFEWKDLMYGDIGVPVYGIEFSETWLLDPPVLNVLPPKNVGAGAAWQPADPLQMEAFKMAIESEKNPLDPKGKKEEE